MLVVLGSAALSASPIVEYCALGGGTNVASSNNLAMATPTFSGEFVCTLPTLPTGNVLTSLDLIVDDDYALGTSGENNEVEFSYGTSGFNGATAVTTTIEGLAGSSPFGVSPTGGAIVGQSGTPTCSLDSPFAFDCEATNLGSQATTFDVFGSSTWISGTVQNGGSDQFSVSFAYTYAPPASPVPEPGPLGMLGGSLIGLFLAARRRRKA